MKRTYFLLLIFIQALLCYPCGNDYEEESHFKLSKVNTKAANNYLTHQVGFDTLALQQKRKALYQKLKTSNTKYKILSDIALIDLKIGNRKQAVHILDSLVNIYPREYNINANLGTGYELIGNNALALKYIAKALEINPHSHDESEWIHVEILKEKIKNNPNYKKIMDLGFDKPLSYYERQYDIKLGEQRIQLAYQLNERIAFIGYHDPIVSQLLTDYADLVAITDNILSPVSVYEKALYYPKADHKYINNRLKEIKSLRFKAYFQYYGPMVLITLILGVLLVLLWRNSDRVLLRKLFVALIIGAVTFIIVWNLHRLLPEWYIFTIPVSVFFVPVEFLVMNGLKQKMRFLLWNIVLVILTMGCGLISAFTLSLFGTMKEVILLTPFTLFLPLFWLFAFVYKFEQKWKYFLVGIIILYCCFFLHWGYLVESMNSTDLLNMMITAWYTYVCATIVFMIAYSARPQSKNVADKIPE